MSRGVFCNPRVRVLELGNYVVPAYAGMILAEQGNYVEKWTRPGALDPIQELDRGDELWQWINKDKNVIPCELTRDELEHALSQSFITRVVDNFRPSTLDKLKIDPLEIALRHGIVWVSVRSEVGERSFDVIAQTRAWGDFAGALPFYLGDTAAGLWAAFKLAITSTPGHYVIGHASCLAKLVEGELVVDADSQRLRYGVSPWDRDVYGYDSEIGATVEYKGERLTEPNRDRAWRLDNLWHDDDGRIII